MRSLDLTVNDTAIEMDKDDNRIVRVKVRKTAPDLFRVKIYLTGSDLPLVNSVKYRLHPSFKDRVKYVARTPSNPNCELVIWAYGMFDVEVDVEDRRGDIFRINYRLKFGHELRKGNVKKIISS